MHIVNELHNMPPKILRLFPWRTTRTREFFKEQINNGMQQNVNPARDLSCSAKRHRVNMPNFPVVPCCYDNYGDRTKQD